MIKMRLEWIIFILAFGACMGFNNPSWTYGQEEATTVTNKLSSRFESFLGSSGNSKNTVSGLRNGTSFEYTDSTGTTKTITPKTGEMGYGEVSHSLRLAEFQLNKAGITDSPTGEQLEAVLNGGTFTDSNGSNVDAQGVLALRSEGKGWGQIAQEYGTKLGTIVGKGKAGQHGLESGQTSSSVELSGKGKGSGRASASATGSGIVSGQGKAYGHSTKGTKKNGIVSGSGKSSGQTYGKGIVSGGGKAYGHSSGRTYGKGIVSGSGRAIGTGGGSGIVTGSGKTAPSHGRVSAGGANKSNGGGQGEKK